MNEVHKRKVFLSHAESDEDLAKQIHQLLEGVSSHAIKIWRSTSSGSIRLGEKPLDQIHKELGEAGKIIIVLTPISCVRPWIVWEPAYVAGLGGRPVIPLLCGVDRREIPGPLQQFKHYSASSGDDLKELVTELLAGLDMAPDKDFLETRVKSFRTKLEEYLRNLPVDPTRNGAISRAASGAPNHSILRPREEFTDKLITHLRDKDTKTIQLITYTTEVNYAFITRWQVKGHKRIEIYKRSILADLAEQQEWNLRRLAAGKLARRWNKRQLSIDASESLLRLAPKGTKITQYFYDPPPTKRAFIFDEREAITAYYKTVKNPLDTDGSAYKGMTNEPALWVTRETDFGKFILDELGSHIASLRMHSRTWDEERRILLERGSWRGPGKRPCVEPRSVFLDLDGVLYDSLPDYVAAWQVAFRSIKLDFPDKEVYRQEGRPGKETIREFLRKRGWSEEDITDEIVKLVHDRKKEEMGRRGNPGVQRGAMELVKAIARSGLDIWVVTGSSDSGTVERIESDFGQLIPRGHVITRNDVRAGKPDPDPFLLACYRANVHPHESVVIENAPLGIESADRAGTFCVAVNTGILPDGDLEAAGARVVFESCGKLAELWPDVVAILRE